MKITFLLNQLLGNALAGGEVRGLKLCELFSRDESFNTSIMLPLSSTHFISKQQKVHKILTGDTAIEKFIITNQLEISSLGILVLYLTRTIQTVKILRNNITDIVYSTGDFFCDVIPCFLAKLKNNKIIFVTCIHHINVSPFIRKQNRFINSLVSYTLQKISFYFIKKNCDLVFVMNSKVRRTLESQGFKSSKIHVVGNGLDIEEIEDIIKSLSYVKPQLRLSYFGRLNDTKGVTDLPAILSAVIKKFPDCYLDLVGFCDENMKKKLSLEFKNKKCLDKVIFHGFVKNKEDVYRILLSSTVIVLPSYEEGWGISLFESVLCKRPVVTYNLEVFEELFGTKFIAAPLGETKVFSELVISYLNENNKKSTDAYIEYCYSIARKFNWNDVFNKEKSLIQQYD